MRDLLLILALWVNQNTGLEYTDFAELPVVEQVAQSTVTARLLLRPVGMRMPSRERRTLAQQAGALYEPRERAILLSSGVDPNSLEGRALLVRELAYMIQLDQGGAMLGVCDEVMARNAIRVQQRFLRAHGVSAPLDGESLLRLSPCSL